MGKKKQSGKSPRRLAKQQRREAQRAAKRHSLRRLPISTGPSEPDLVGAAAQYFAGDDSLPDSPDALATVLSKTVLDSADLAEEPELSDLMFDPLQSVEAFAKASEELGVDSASPDGADMVFDVMQRAAEEVLTEEALQEIGERLARLRARWKRAGEHRLAARVAVVDMAMRQDSAVCSAMGLVLAIVARSVNAGCSSRSSFIRSSKLFRASRSSRQSALYGLDSEPARGETKPSDYVDDHADDVQQSRRGTQLSLDFEVGDELPF